MARPLTVLQLLPKLNEGGVERGTVELANYLVQQGHRALVVSGGGVLVDDLQACGASHFCLDIGRKSIFTLRHIQALRHFIQQLAPDIVHVRSRLPAWINYFAFNGIKAELRPKLISTVHGAYSVNAYSKIMLHADNIIAISDYIHSYISNHYPQTSNERISVVHRGVDTNQYNLNYQPSSQWIQDWFEQYPQSRDKIILCLPGRLTRLKGQLDFIALCKQLKSHSLDFHAFIVGGHNSNKQRYVQQLHQAVSENDLTTNISFTGSRADLHNILSISNVVYSLSTQAEAFGRTTLEALALGTPVIAYDHGGAAEILQTLCPDGLIKLNDIYAGAEKTLAFIKQAPQIKRNDIYTLDSMLEKTLLLYQKTLEAKN